MKATVSIAHGRVNLGLESENPLEADCLELFGTQSIDHGGIWIASHGSVPDARRRSVLIQAKPAPDTGRVFSDEIIARIVLTKGQRAPEGSMVVVGAGAVIPAAEYNAQLQGANDGRSNETDS